MQITVRCPIFPTEGFDHVKKAVSNLFANDLVERKEQDGALELFLVSSKRDTLEELRLLIHDLRIIDAVRSRINSNWSGFETLIRFDKQAAYVEKLRLVDDSEENPPLGCIEVSIEFDTEEEFEQFVLWFTPPTKDGRVVMG
ncbi:MAG: RNA-binding domain-containing protein [Candidatus Thorarchaeota archaeon]|jgi:predicted RNA binding protein with dsRBD fold (UPF0201 family)